MDWSHFGGERPQLGQDQAAMRIAAAAVLCSVAAAQAPANIAAARPGPRSQPGLIYHSQHQRILLIDGTYPAVQRGATELWSWDGREWALLPATGSRAPAARHASAAVYDSQRNRVVTFAGRLGLAEQIKNDTWEWDGARWSEMTDAGMGARDHHMMAYDSARGRTVLFGGGLFPRQAGPWPTDTWEWDGTRWSRVDTAGPVGRIAAMVYDSRRREMVMFGGVGQSPGAGQPQPNFGDTWTWNGQTWRKAAEGGPRARDRHAMAFDSKAGVMLLYGGGTRAGQFDDMWKWDGEAWRQIALTGQTPGRRELHAMAYDPARDRTVLFGGNNDGKVVDDVWEWDGKSWTRVQ
jgi:hypothetical protein